MDPRHQLADPDSRFVDLLDTEVHLRLAGDAGPRVVLLHHFFGNVANWRHVLELLAPHARVAAFDRPGFGLTERPDEPRRYTRGYAADLTAALMDHLGWGDAVLVGASAGGTTALEVYDRHPERVAGLALVSPAITGDVGSPAFLRPLLRQEVFAPLGRAVVGKAAGDLSLERVARSWADPSRASQEDLEAYRRTTRVPGWRDAIWTLANVEGTPSLRSLLPRIDVPAVVITGDEDRVISPRWNRRTANAIPTAHLEVIEDCGHTPHEERPDALVAVLRSLLERTASSER
ncbi:MAG: alpha/beta hydrolase [Nitriliruptorales bacterium]|nr:alpha/beta hydrolase [Nitriliruptorales bacterium]